MPRMPSTKGSGCTSPRSPSNSTNAIGNIIAEGQRANVAFPASPGRAAQADLHQAVQGIEGRRPYRAQSRHVAGPLEPGQAREVPRPDRPLLLRLNEKNVVARSARPATANTVSTIFLPQRRRQVRHLPQQRREEVSGRRLLHHGGREVGDRCPSRRSGRPLLPLVLPLARSEPVNGLGWKAFTTVIERIKTHLRDRVVWMRSSGITDHYRRPTGGASWIRCSAKVPSPD